VPTTAILAAIEELRIEALARTWRLTDDLEAARRLTESGRAAEAAAAYRTLVASHPNSGPAWAGLTRALLATGELERGVEAAVRSLELEPASAAVHHSLGLFMPDPRSAQRAMTAYARHFGVACDDDLLSNLRTLAAARAETSSATGVWEDRVTLGNVLMAAGAIEAAVEAYSAAAVLAPRQPQVLRNLAEACAIAGRGAESTRWLAWAFVREGRVEQAAALLEELAATGLEDFESATLLGDCYRSMDRLDAAIDVYRRVVRLAPTDVAGYRWLAALLQHTGHPSAAIRVAADGARRCPRRLALEYARGLTLPVVYSSDRQLSRFRKHYAAGLERLVERTRLDTAVERREALDLIGTLDNFYLPYQGHNDVGLQTTYGQWVTGIVNANFPDFPAPPVSSRGSRLRVGYVSGHCRRHAVANIFGGWLRHADREAFEIHCFHLDEIVDGVTEELRRASDVFHHLPHRTEVVARRIREAGLDVLVHLDIGMYRAAVPLAALRLAPVQCTTWGHPQTSGLPAIDYFISTDLMEPEDGQRYYTERLVRLPKIGVSYARPDRPEHPTPRSGFGWSDDDIIYLCCQAPFKYLPQHDHLLAKIAARAPRARFVFASDHPARWRLADRLAAVFARAGLDPWTHLSFVTRQAWPEYLSALLAADVFLDTLEWTGCNTSLDAIAMGLPVVTCPVQTPRGLYSRAFLEVLGVTETIARNPREYVDLAVALGTDRPARARVSAAMIARHQHLFDDVGCVRALEDFYRCAVREGARVAGSRAAEPSVQ
jgi:protein O-GlcNAc transferase